jgi:hypothetical protein
MRLCCTCGQRPPRKAGRNCLQCHALANKKYRAKTIRVDRDHYKKLEQIYNEAFHAWPSASD